ncbi:MAG TPA: hypothetical protein VFU06_08810 [Longimicrobiales bacterium]|nr:hypothetical protein [Longimicrobiales bacterium]
MATLPAACGDLPTDVTDTTGLHATETGLSAQVSPYSRSAVFRAAIDAVIETEGSQLLWRRTASLRAHSAAARAAQERADTAAQLAAEQMHRDAQVAFMAYALGDARIDDIVHQVRGAVDDARMRLDVLRTGGHDVTRAAVLVQDADALLARSGSQPVDVLATALDAADVLARLDQILRSVERLPSLDELFAATISEVRESAGPRAARALLAEHQTLVREAQGALADGGRVRAHDRLQQVRERQVRIVAQRMGESGVRRHVGAVVAAEKALQGFADERRRVVARDYLDQAISALARGEVARALDRAAVAAEIVNALAAESSRYRAAPAAAR